MSDNFKQTVNLRAEDDKKKMDPPRVSLKRRMTHSHASQKPLSRSMEIDRVYGENQDVLSSPDLQKINRPPKVRVGINFNMNFGIIILSIVVLIFAYFFIFSKDKNVAEVTVPEEKWYMVKLSDASVYYGQISDVASDPIVIRNVYYNYDQLKPNESTEGETKDSTSLRLVKRGKESHGPNGTMSIVRSQVLFMEPLKEESKVLQAILDYEK